MATLIFDEVDTGVSGRAAQKVAEKLRSVCLEQAGSLRHPPAPDCRLGRYPSAHRQGGSDGRTYTTVTPLDREGRKLELARIIGGASITEITLKSAEEMLTSGCEVTAWRRLAGITVSLATGSDEIPWRFAVTALALPRQDGKRKCCCPGEIGNSALTTSEVTCKIFIAAAYYNGRRFILCKEILYDEDDEKDARMEGSAK